MGNLAHIHVNTFVCMQTVCFHDFVCIQIHTDDIRMGVEHLSPDADGALLVSATNTLKLILQLVISSPWIWFFHVKTWSMWTAQPVRPWTDTHCLEQLFLTLTTCGGGVPIWILIQLVLLDSLLYLLCARGILDTDFTGSFWMSAVLKYQLIKSL